MDTQRKEQDPTLVCTCNDLYIEEIRDAINIGIYDYLEIMQYSDTLLRCGECQPHVEILVKEILATTNKTTD
ncbi:(2Fe-2S)-binding protein [Psychromonas sp. RZ22]|uniref:(2Fe-2S)-binding protein n=1 Tax=Psychromonas algarum TaxID=2555643 RepID=UPI0010672B15|nr:(2Fe-2S)-binding protein [Psychromonas sp. RZ22]TEW53734.1 (2Fe-2S)-binding protein [Psychromonas sp. RZ22]